MCRHPVVFVALSVLFLLSAPPGRAAPPAAPSTALVGGTVIDPSGATIADGVVLLQGDRITAVRSRSEIKIPAGARVVSIAGRFVVPGLIDAHVHFFQSGGLYTRPDIFDLRARVPYAEEQARLRLRLDETLARTLRSGVTAVVDMGGPFWNFELRARAAQNPRAPRVAVAGPLISSVSREALDLGDPPIIRCTSPEEARALVRREAERAPDFIKIWYVVTPDQPVQKSLPMVQAAADEAHRLGLRLAVHATELAAAKAALSAGADVLVHGVMDTDVDAEFLDLCRRRGVVYIPTLIVSGNYQRVAAGAPILDAEELSLGEPFAAGSLFDLSHIPTSELPPRLRTLRSVTPAPLPPALSAVAARNLLAVHKAGIRVALGTDAGNIGTLHGASVFREMAAMEAAGLTPIEVLRAATAGGAQVLSPKPGRGRIAAGAPADLLVLRADPRSSSRNLARIQHIVRAGEVIDPETLVPDGPEALAQRQLNAYNARDIDSFLRVYSADVEVMELDGKVSLKGQEAMRARYAPLFESSPLLHCELVKRMVIGSWVVDEERVTGRGPEPIHAAAIYEIRDGRIARIRFLR